MDSIKTRVITSVSQTEDMESDLLTDSNGSLRKIPIELLTEKIRKGLLNQILDPDHYPITPASDNSKTVTIDLEEGNITNTGELTEEAGIYRTPDYIEILDGMSFSNSGNQIMKFYIYDENKNFISGWNDGYSYAWRNPGTLDFFPPGAKYFKCLLSSDEPQTMTIAIGTVEEQIKAEHKRVYLADHGYVVYGDIIDDAAMHKLVIEALGLDDNEYNITEIKAPVANPHEATLALMNVGNGCVQFVDFSSMTYDADNPTVEIVCQTRGQRPLPYFCIAFNNGNGQGRVRKLRVDPDCIPVRLTSEGIEVRRNNTFSNTGSEEEYVIVNLAELKDAVDALSNGGTVYPSYIIDESARVSNEVLHNRSANSFVFAALSDIHLECYEYTRTGASHTAAALNEIKKRVPLDMITLLGDYVDGDSTDDTDQCNTELLEIRQMFYDTVRDVPSIWAVGNHDNAHYYTRDDPSDRTNGNLMYSYLGSNNRDTVIDPENRQRIYGYRDFEQQKIRVIYLNTSDVSDNTTSSSTYISNQQLTWLQNTALDFSSKSDVNNWGILFLTHYPIDWNSATQSLLTIINDYISGDGTEGAKRAEVIAAFHGHTHNYLVNTIGVSGFPSIAIPQVCFGRNNEYATDPDKPEFGEFEEDGVTPIYYAKTENSAQDTSFNIITIDRILKKIYCTNYGAGINREIQYAEYTPPVTVTITTAGEWVVGSISTTNGVFDDGANTSRVSMVTPKPVPANTVITVSASGIADGKSIYVLEYDADDNYVGNFYFYNGDSATTSATTAYIRLRSTPASDASAVDVTISYVSEST